MKLFKTAKRGPDKHVGTDFYTAHWSGQRGQPEMFRIQVYGVDGIGPGYSVQCTRDDARKIVEHFTKYLAKPETT